MRIGRKYVTIPLITLFLSLLLLVGSNQAFASSGPTTAVITGNSLSETSDFSSASVNVLLDGTDQTAVYQVASTVSDLTGSGAGWHYQESATPLTDGHSHNLTQQITSVDGVRCDASGGTCTVATSSISTYPLNMDSTARPFFNALAQTGLGLIDLVAHMKIYVPANAYAGTYTSTVTYAIVSGP